MFQSNKINPMVVESSENLPKPETNREEIKEKKNIRKFISKIILR